MCGIIGYTGYDEARGILIKGLKSLEYRGYDSAGIGVYNKEKKECIIKKCTGRVNTLEKKTDDMRGTCGIGHTRWATHGGVSDSNSHPHKFGEVSVVHNGIIENCETLKHTLGVENELKSDTDSELAAVLIDKYYNSDPIVAISKAVKELSGTFALAIMFDSIPDAVYTVRNVSPIVCCSGENGSFIASDIIALAEYCNEYFVLPEFSIAEVTKEKITVFDLDKNIIHPQMIKTDSVLKSSGKDGYPFYMEKEICEQPSAIKNTLESRISNGQVTFKNDNIDEAVFSKCKCISVIACGTAMHAGLIGKNIIEKYCRIPVTVYNASEYMYSSPIISNDTLVICVSQSGETIDTLEALKYAKRNNAMSISIVNVRNSSIARESDNVIYTDAGPEIAVASTKAYTTQSAIFYLIAAKIAKINKQMNENELFDFTNELLKIPQSVEDIINRKNEIHALSSLMLSSEHAFMIGRGIDFPALLEASLKLKEISYIHSEAFASGELKHGTIALITESTPVISLLTQEKLKSKQISNVKEVQSRGALVISFIKKSFCDNCTDNCFLLPELKDDFMPIPSVAALQYFAYFVSSDKGLDVDKPRNLAKVVTVE